MKKIIKKLSVLDIIVGILFIVVSILSIIQFGLIGLLAIPILLLLIIIYYNSNKISSFILKKDNKTKKKKEYNIDEEFEDDDIILKKEKKEIYAIKEVDKVKKAKKKTTNKKKKKKNKKKQKTGKKTLKVILSIFLIFCIIGILSVAGFLAYIVITTEDFDPNKLTYQDQTVVYDKNGNIFATLGTQKRESVTYSELPQVLIDAILATEDARFFQHNGVDFARFLKASFYQLIGKSAGGASTLTMQVSKNNLTSTESKGIQGIIRKFRDVYISVFQIEKKYTKEQIIEFYVNDNLLGGSNYGVEQASQYYFGKSVSELNLAEASTLAGIFQSPNSLRPDKNPEGAEKRRNLVLDLMVRHGYITKEEAEITKAISVESLIVAKADTETYQGFLDTVVAEVETKTGDNPYSVSMKIYTTLDTSIQDGIDDIMDGTTYTWENEAVQAGIAVISVNTGEVVAIGAGRNKDGLNTWNYATQERNHPGSTAKPIFDYGPGFEYSNYSTYTLFNDEPWTYTNGPSVSNWNGTFDGLMTLRTALAQSRNIPALKTFQQNDKTKIKSFVESLGITPESPLHESHAIGGFNGVTPLELSAAYAAFANGGYYIEPHTVTKIEYRDTGEIEEFKYTKERVMSASTAFMINSVLQYAVETGSDGGSRVYGKTVAAKTGTSSFDEATIQRYNMKGDAVNDLWTAAYTPEYSFSLWYGYKETSSEYYNTNSTGTTYKNNLMRQVVKCIPMTTKSFDIPDTVVQSEVEFGTWPAQLPSEYTPSNLIVNEYFVKGTEPTEVSERFSQFDDITNLETKKINNTTIELTWDYEVPELFQESYLKKYFSQTVFGNGTDKFVNERLNSYGGLGFGIYKVNEDNEETFLEFTTEKEYKFTNTTNEDVYILIKVQYKDYQANASKGVRSSALVSGKNNNIKQDEDNEETKTSLKAKINKTANYQVGKYVETDFKITYNNRDITNLATVVYTLEAFSTQNKNEFENEINKLEVGIYTLKYKISYNGETVEYTKTLTLK